MGKCSLHASQQAVLLARKLEAGMDKEQSLQAFYSAVKNENAAAVAQIVYAAAVLPENLETDLIRGVKEEGAVREYIKSHNAVADYTKFVALGIGNYAEFVAAIELNTKPTQAEVQEEDVINIDVNYSDKDGALLPISIKTASPASTETYGNDLIKKRQARIDSSEGLKTEGTARLENFLSIYFPGTSEGAEFIKWSKDLFYDSMISHKQGEVGFMEDVSGTINKIIAEQKKLQEAGTKMSPGDQEQHFRNILLTDFDFILNAVIPILSLDTKQTKKANIQVTGFVDTVGNELPVMTIDGGHIQDKLEKDGDKDNLYHLKDGVINPELQIAPMTSYTFLNDKTLPENSIFQLDDGSVWYRDDSDNNYEVTRKPIYSYSLSSKRNTDSIDHYINPINQGTNFINGIFPMMRYVEVKDGEYVYGERMRKSDYLSIAPYLLDAGRTLEEFTDTIKHMAANGIGKNKRIAKSLEVHLFSKTPTTIKDVGEVHSIATAPNNKLHNVNEDIVKALYSALVSKELTRRILVEENFTRVTNALGNTSYSTFVNNQLSGMLTNSNGNTQRNIADHIRILEDNEVMILSKAGDTRGALLSKLVTKETLQPAMRSLGLEPLFNQIMDSIKLPTYSEEIELLNAVRNIIEIAAANVYSKNRKNILDLSHIKNNFTNDGFRRLAPSAIISGSRLELLAEVFHPETTKNIQVAGEKVSPSNTPNRDAYIPTQLFNFEEHSNNVSPVKANFMPILPNLLDEDSDIPKAKYIGNLIKTPIIKDGEVVGVADWTLKVRFEHAMITGFINAPRDLAGKKFFIQPVNYSDKSAIEMHEIDSEENLLMANNAMTEKLIKGFIEYNYKKYEYLQKQSIEGLKDFIGGSYEYIKSNIDEDKHEALDNLRDMLVYKTYPQQGDMTRTINALLSELQLDPDLATFHDNELDKDADYVSFEGYLYLKPHMGVRAEAFRTNGDEITRKYLEDHRELLNEYKVDSKLIGEALENSSITNLKVDDFFDRFFLINGTLGHSLKVATMGDESYFKTRYSAKTIAQYYADIDSGKTTGLEETAVMLQNQYKRAQSVLSRGVLYAQKETLVGLRRRHRKNNMLSFANIQTINGKEVVNFKKLEGKTIEELFALDILVPFEDGSLMNTGEEEFFVRLRIGDEIATVSSASVYEDVSTAINRLQYEEGAAAEASAVREASEADPRTIIIENLPKITPESAREETGTNTGNKEDIKTAWLSKEGISVNEAVDYFKMDFFSEIDNVDETFIRNTIIDVIQSTKAELLSRPLVRDTKVNTLEPLAFLFEGEPVFHEAILDFIHGFKGVDKGLVSTHKVYEGTVPNDTDNNITITKLRSLDNKTDNVIVMPDFMSSFTVDDPNTYVNLLNAMDLSQDNSDAIQVFHPLMMLIMDQARGGKFGAFHTDNNEAVKTITLTFEYNRFRQILQKKSGQNPFSYEQFKKTGSIELLNTLRAMNSAVEFRQQTMRIVDEYKGQEVVSFAEFKNLDELFEYFGGYTSRGDAVWNDVLRVLKDNPVNMYDFVGYVTVPSNQKTGHKKFNRWEDVFSRRGVNNDPVIDYMGNEYNFEVLTKAHGYDVSGNAENKSTLALLSQLVNAVGFGGNSDLAAKNLQNAMSAVMEISSLRSGYELAEVAADMKKRTAAGRGDTRGYNKVIQRLAKGDPSTNGFTDAELEAYRTVMRAGLHETASLAFNEGLDSVLIKDMIEDDSRSLDTPAVMAKVIGTIRSSLFKDTVKLKMSGFIATVSAVHNTMNIYDLPLDTRRGRYGFIKHLLTHGEEGTAGKVVRLTKEDLYTEDGKEIILININGELVELDQIILPWDQIKRNGYFTTAGDRDIFADIQQGSFIDIVITPDILEKPQIDSLEKLGLIDDNVPIKANGKRMLTWYYKETTDKAQVEKDISSGSLSEDTTEKYNLKFYDLRRVDDKTSIRDTEAFRNYYRGVMDAGARGEAIDEDEKKRLVTLLIVESQRKNEDGTPVYETVIPEVVLPTFMRSAFGIAEGTSLVDIIGTDGNDAVNAKEYFKSRSSNRFFRLEDTRKPILLSRLLIKYNTRVALRSTKHEEDILKYLKKLDGDVVSVSELKHINSLIIAARQDHSVKQAEDFIKTLKVVLTRIPGQGKQSGFAGQIVELFDGQGNASHAGTEHLTNTGGDMDIDTLSVLTKTLDSSGRIFDHTDYITADGFNGKGVVEDFKKELYENIDIVEEAVNETNDYIRSQIKILRTQVVLDGEEEADEGDLLNIQAKLEKQLITPEKRDRILKDRERKIAAKYANILSNAVEDGIYTALVNVDSMIETNTPITMEMFDSIIEGLPKIDQSSVHGESYTSIFTYEDRNAQGKMGIGVYATVLKINSAIQVAKMYYDAQYKDIIDGRSGLSNPFIFNFNLKYFDIFAKKEVSFTQTSYSDIDRFSISKIISRDSQLQDALVNVLASKETKAEPLIKLLNNEVDIFLDEYPSTETEVLNEVLVSKAKSLFNIDLTTKNPQAEIKRKLKKPEMISKAYVEVLGKQLSSDAQSQFLSAATDNAKALILGKIRSNNLTNSIITTMLLLNFKADAVIKFLFDPSVEAVLDHYNTEQGKLKKVRLNIADIENGVIKGISKNDASMKSLVQLIEISDEVTKFRNVRNLQENFTIDPHKLDKILDELDSDHLYKAIIADDITRIIPQNEAQKIFNPNMFVFLHPQSRSLFKNLYEIEMYKVPALFHTSTILRRYLTKHRTPAAYKNTVAQMSRSLVDKYLATPVDGLPYRGVRVIRSGENYTKSYIDVDTNTGREEFIDSFQDYFEYARREHVKLTGKSNPLFTSFGFSIPYKEKHPVMNIPLLKHADTDDVEVAVIKHSIEELRVETDNTQLNAFKQELYRNLSLYALITSGGQIKKSSMIELFKEITYDLGTFINSLSEQDFLSTLPETTQGKLVVVGDIPFKAALSEAAMKKNSNDWEEEPMTPPEDMDGEMEKGGYLESDQDPDQDNEFEMSSYAVYKWRPDLKNSRVLEKTERYTRNKVYTTPSIGQFGKMIFQGADTVNKPPYRLFPKRAYILPQNSNENNLSFRDLDKDILNDMTHIGYQVGMSVSYDGDPARIVAFSGHTKSTSEVPAHDRYIISTLKGEKEVAGIHLMEENDDLLLYGNVIEEVNSNNLRAYEYILEKQKDLSGLIPNRPERVGEGITRDERIIAAFTPRQILKNPIINKETAIIGLDSAGGARAILKVDKLGALADSESYSVYHKTEDLPRAVPGSRGVLVPSFTIKKGSKGDARYKAAEIASMKGQILQMLNSLTGKTDVLNLYGLNINANKGGAALIASTLKDIKGFKVQLVKSKEIEGLVKYMVTRTVANKIVVPVNGETTFMDTKTDRKTKRVTLVRDRMPAARYEQVAIKALDLDLWDIPHKRVMINLNGTNFNSIVIFPGQSTQRIYVILNDNVMYDGVYQIVKETAQNVAPVTFAEETMTVRLNRDAFKQLNSTISQDTSPILKPLCP